MFNNEQRKRLEWYDSLSTFERLVVNYWLLTGDNRLVLALRNRSERLQRFWYQSFVERPEESPLHRG